MYKKKNKSDFHHYKTDEFMVKFLRPTSDGVRVVVYMRRKERRPNTLSMYENPIFECNVNDLLGDDKGSFFIKLINSMIDNSDNTRALLLSRKTEDEEKEVSNS